jgi:hypothetical protein
LTLNRSWSWDYATWLPKTSKRSKS